MNNISSVNSCGSELKQINTGPINNPFIIDLPFECVEKILIYLGDLSIRNLVSFEMVAEGHQQLTQRAWKHIKDTYFLNWEACKDDPDSDKWNACLSEALKSYLLYYTTFSDSKPLLTLAQRCRNKFDGLMKRYPCFKMYIQEDLIEWFSTTSQQDGKFSKEKNDLIFTAFTGKWGGEALMVALLEMKEFAKSNNQKSLDLANQNLQLIESGKSNYISECVNSLLMGLDLHLMEKSFIDPHSLYKRYQLMLMGQKIALRSGSFAPFLNYYFPSVDLSSLQILNKPVIEKLCLKDLKAINGFQKTHWQKAKVCYQQVIAFYSDPEKMPHNIKECFQYINERLEIKNMR